MTSGRRCVFCDGGGKFYVVAVRAVLLCTVAAPRHNAAEAGDVGEMAYPATETSDRRDYCLHESFNATCRPSNVLMMTSATYGRMRLGRCINGDFNIGCSTDVIAYFDSQCTARRSCDVSVRNLVDIHPCQRDFMSYLEASYKCVEVPTPDNTKCSAEGHIGFDVGSTSGFLIYGPPAHSSQTPDDIQDRPRPQPPGPSRTPISPADFPTSPGGSRTCPWTISAKPGQRIRFELVVVSVGGGGGVAPFADGDRSASSGGSTDDELQFGLPGSGPRVCPETLTLTDSSLQGPGVQLAVCAGRQRSRVLYLSVGHSVTLYVGAEDARQTSHQSAARFVLTYEAVGCPDVTVPANAWMKRTSDNVMIKCNDSLETWYMTCQGNRWIGDVTNCSHKGFPLIRQDETRKPTVFPAHGLLLAILLGIALGILLGVLLLFALHCARRRSDDSFGRHKSAMLMLPARVDDNLDNMDPSDPSDPSTRLPPSTIVRHYNLAAGSESSYPALTIDTPLGGPSCDPFRYDLQDEVVYPSSLYGYGCAAPFDHQVSNGGGGNAPDDCACSAHAFRTPRQTPAAAADRRSNRRRKSGSCGSLDSTGDGCGGGRRKFAGGMFPVVAGRYDVENEVARTRAEVVKTVDMCLSCQADNRLNIVSRH